MVTSDWIDYDYAFIRVVPHVHLATFVTVGVVLHVRTIEFLDLRVRLDPGALAVRWPELDVAMVESAIEAFRQVCAGAPDGGAMGVLTPSERFHWLTTPRSCVVQTSDVHGGRTRDAVGTLDHLFDTEVTGG
jgi:hypothetical protein